MIYVDNAATTRLDPAALDAMLPYLSEGYGNPSSLHTLGQNAAGALAQARRHMADLLNCAPEELVFTSGGTESDNHAIFEAARAGAKAGKRHLVTTKIEHHAVLRPMERLEEEGFTVTYVPVSATGLVDPQDVEDAIQDDTCLVSIMTANNEVGTIEPIADIGEICRDHGVLFHTDAVQAVGHCPLDLHALPIDLLSLSAHKFNGPKGTGALYMRDGAALDGHILGGGQERGKRAGTENVPGIVGMVKALERRLIALDETTTQLQAYQKTMYDMAATIPHCKVNGDFDHRLPGNVHFSFAGISGEALLVLLDSQGICASVGSACEAGSVDPSHVLLALGLDTRTAMGSLRLTFSHENTQAEADTLAYAVPRAVEKLRSTSPVWRQMEEGALPYGI